MHTPKMPCRQTPRDLIAYVVRDTNVIPDKYGFHG